MNDKIMVKRDIVIIGGGPAGLAAALAAKKEGAESILILERDKELGGILNQCIHNGFGLHTFQEEHSGISSGRHLFCRNSTASCKHGRLYAGKKGSDPGIR